VAGAILAALLLIGYSLLPLLVRHLLEQRLEGLLGRRVEVARVHINPLKLSVSIEDLGLFERDRQTLFAGFSRLYLDLQWASLYRRAAVLREVRLETPWLRLIRLARSGGRASAFNVSDVMERIAARTPGPDQDLPRLAIANLSVRGGGITLEDRLLGRIHTLSEVQLALPSLSTLPGQQDGWVDPVLEGRFDGAPFSVRAHGRPLQPGSGSSLRLRLDGLDLPGLAPYLPGRLPIRMRSARLDLDLQIGFAHPEGRPPTVALSGRVAVREVALEWSRRPLRLALDRMQVAIGSSDLFRRQIHLRQIQLAGLDLRRHRGGGPEPLLRLPSLELEGLSLDIRGRSVRIERLRAQGGELHSQREAEGQIDVVEHAADAGLPALAAWQSSVGRVELRDWQVHFRDRRVQPAAVFEARNFDLSAAGLSSDPERTGSVDLGLDLVPRGRIEIGGALAVAPARADLTVKLRELPLPTAQPYLGRRTDLLLTGGALSGSVRLRLQTEGPAPGLSLTGDFDLERLSASHARTHEPLISWRLLHVGGLSFATARPGLTITDVQLLQPVGRLVKRPDGRLNLSTLLRRSGPPAEKAPTAGRLEIGRVGLRGGRLVFLDRQIRPSTRIELQGVDAQLTRLSTRAGSQAAAVKLQATVDRTGWLAVSGGFGPLSQEWAMDLAIDARNIELPTFSPYAARYVGYPVHRGKLTMSLGYRVVERRLTARNRLRFDQLSLGEQTDSPDAVRLPVRLAVAALTDRHGIIDLNVPLSGSLDDPNFRLLPIIRRTLGDLTLKAATAPLRLITSTLGVGDDEKTAEIAFPSGMHTVDASVQAGVPLLARELRDRPALLLEIQGQADPERDRPGLEKQGLATDQEALRALAGRRAAAIRDALARSDPGVAGRLFLSEPQVAPTARPVGVELRLHAR
jgi:hypothetical protein